MRWGVALLAVAAAGGHELGGTRAVAVFGGDGRYSVEIVTDAAALVEKLHGLTGDAPPDPSRLEEMLRAAEARFRQRVRLSFGTEEARPAIVFGVAPAADGISAPMATVRLTGAVPEGAREFTWTYGWTFSTYALGIRGGAGETVTEWIEGGQRSKPFALTAAAAGSGVAWRYLTLGFTHIVPYGLDHVLFVLGLYLLSRRLGSVLWQVSAFTAAHSITLALGIYGVIAAPASVVEPLIALSIAYVAIENIVHTELKPWRLALVFGFGLLHGMGFAGVLSELGLPRSEFLTALVSFNAGVEAGQLTVIGAAFMLAGRQFSHQPWYRGRVVIPASLGIACTAVYWTIERLLA